VGKKYDTQWNYINSGHIFEKFIFEDLDQSQAQEQAEELSRQAGGENK